MKSIERIGIFGGTFNPVDNAHILISKQFIKELNIEKCYIVPANISPFKTNNESILIPSNHRIELLKIAFSTDKEVEICTYEIDKGGVSYSFDTIQYLKSRHSDSEFFILIGSDQAVSFKEWKEWEWILNNTQICIAMRPGFSTIEKIKEFLKINNKMPYILNSPLLTISSTEIRKMIINGEEIEKYIPPEVGEYIKTNNLYI